VREKTDLIERVRAEVGRLAGAELA
jgi:hypothetical protein